MDPHNLISEEHENDHVVISDVSAEIKRFQSSDSEEQPASESSLGDLANQNLNIARAAQAAHKIEKDKKKIRKKEKKEKKKAKKEKKRREQEESKVQTDPTGINREDITADGKGITEKDKNKDKNKRDSESSESSMDEQLRIEAMQAAIIK